MRRKQRTGDSLRLYRIWKNIRARCYCFGCKDYRNYGARGIKVSWEWEDPDQFIVWDMSSGYERGLQLDRKDNNGPYSSENCRWVNSRINSRNRRNNRYIEALGMIKLLVEWQEFSGIGINTISRRIDVYGWSPDRAVTDIDRVRRHY